MTANNLPSPSQPIAAVPVPNAGMSDVARMMQYDAAKKSAGIAYLLWFFLGAIGVHRFYLGQTGTGATQLVIFILSFLLLFVYVGVFGFIVLGIWVLVDAFLIPGITQKYNTDLAAKMALR